MLTKIDSNKMGASNHGWLKSKFHFSFAEYYNPNNSRFEKKWLVLHKKWLLTNTIHTKKILK